MFKSRNQENLVHHVSFLLSLYDTDAFMSESSSLAADIRFSGEKQLNKYPPLRRLAEINKTKAIIPNNSFKVPLVACPFQDTLSEK